MYILNYIYHFFFSVLRSPLLFDLSHDRSDAASPCPPIDNCIHSSSFFFSFVFQLERLSLSSVSRPSSTHVECSIAASSLNRSRVRNNIPQLIIPFYSEKIHRSAVYERSVPPPKFHIYYTTYDKYTLITDRSVSSSSSLFFIFFPILSPSSLSVPVAFFLLFLRHYLFFFFFYARKTRGTFVIMIIRKRRFPGVCIHRRRNNRAENSIEYVYIYI